MVECWNIGKLVELFPFPLLFFFLRVRCGEIPSVYFVLSANKKDRVSSKEPRGLFYLPALNSLQLDKIRLDCFREDVKEYLWVADSPSPLYPLSFRAAMSPRFVVHERGKSSGEILP